MVFVYLSTILITSVWLYKCLRAKKIIFRKTSLDIPLIIFVGSQLASTIFSIDRRTSFLGYYSRFNGGFLSTLCYSLLYWAYVANLNRKQAQKSIAFLLISAALVSVYGVFEHFGIDKNLWVQDVQNRVFSTLGQPNWLATFVAALIPLTWSFIIKRKHPFVFYPLSLLFFATLLFTKSRSGLLGFIFADILFWSYFLFKYHQKYLKKLLFIHLSFFILALSIGFPYSLIKNSPTQTTSTAPALEVGGTESGTIRKIVWKGALGIWARYPIFGSGVETFAYSYYQTRPMEHNLVSEWDFLYNKAHNEYLNFAANTGIVGLVSYLILIGSAIYLLWRRKKIALLAGYVSILTANFFGFSVVPAQLQLFLFPALAVTLGVKQNTQLQTQPKNKSLFFLCLAAVSIFAILGIFPVCRYWYADTFYAKGKANREAGNFPAAQNFYLKAIQFSPYEAIYHNDLATVYANIALALYRNKDSEKTVAYIPLAIVETNRARELSPANLNILRSRASVFTTLATIDKKYFGAAKDTLLTAQQMAPTDAKITYTLALVYLRTGEADSAVKALQKAIEMKPNYKDARYFWALILIENQKYDQAKEQLNYILEKIDPRDENAQKQLQNLK
jgi:O-antigen ligase/Flp pilus assembly protein TadD